MKSLKQIGIFTGKFKPPHIGHYSSILQIAKDNDETYIFVSPKSEGSITGEMATAILKLYFSKKPNIHIHLAEVTPVSSAYEFVEKLGKNKSGAHFRVNLYALPEDMNRFGQMEKWLGENTEIERIETDRPEFIDSSTETTKDPDGVSGTLMRKFVNDNDKTSFFKGLPNSVDKDEIWKIIKKEVTENGTYSIPADSFDQSQDMNIQPSLINVQTGGIPRHWSPSTRYSRIDLKNNQIAKSTSKMVKTFSEFVEESQAINNVFNK